MFTATIIKIFLFPSQQNVYFCISLPNMFVSSRPPWTVAYRPAAKQWLGKQRPLLGNARNIQARDNRRTVFSMWSAPLPLLCNSAVNTHLQQRNCVFCVVRAEGLFLRQLALQFSCGLFALQWRREHRSWTVLLRFVAGRCLVGTLQRRSHCWQLLPSNE
jgi:hypothetical protein